MSLCQMTNMFWSLMAGITVFMFFSSTVIVNKVFPGECCSSEKTIFFWKSIRSFHIK